MLVLILLFLGQTNASPTMCHCPNGGLGMTCPSPIQLNCPPTQCPPAPPCNPFPTIPTLDPNSGLQFTFPTLAPLAGSPFSGLSTTPLPLPVAPPANGQESLLPIANQPGVSVPQAGVPPPPPPPSYAQPDPAYPAVGAQPAGPQVNVQTPSVDPIALTVDATTKATTLASEQYVEQESPEGGQEEVSPSSDSVAKYSVFENEPNNGYRQPVRRALAPSNKPETFSEKCNDERLRKIIELNVDNNPSTSKRKIQKAATEEIGGLFDVICSAHDFSYLANTQLFCEAGNDEVTCFAFLHSLIQ